MKVLTLILAAMLDFIPAGPAWLRQLQPRDSILVADQIEYGFQLDSLPEGTDIQLFDYKVDAGDSLLLWRGWQVDTTARLRIRQPGTRQREKRFSLRGSVVIVPFVESTYRLPDIVLLRNGRDTLVFEGLDLDVKTMPVDTATYQLHDIKGEMRYPLTAKETIPWVMFLWLAIIPIAVIVCLLLLRKRRETGVVAEVHDPAHIVALRELDKWRDEGFWAPDKQKAFYSGITDALKTYIGDRFGVDAPEMTTAELFDALREEKSIPADLREDLRGVFECADFVKFAKHVAPDEENARALPTAVRFVNSTYQTMLEEEQKTPDEL